MSEPDELLPAARATMTADLRALTVRQPWAGAIMWFGKTVENRTRRTGYRGPLLIHAGLHAPEWHDFLIVRDTALGVPVNWDDARRTLGAILGLATVTGCHHADDCATDGKSPRERHCSPWAQPGQFHIEMSDPRPLREPVPCRGALGLWRLPADAEKAVREQMEGT
jgi:hypothetical protein